MEVGKGTKETNQTSTKFRITHAIINRDSSFRLYPFRTNEESEGTATREGTKERSQGPKKETNSRQPNARARQQTS